MVKIHFIVSFILFTSETTTVSSDWTTLEKIIERQFPRCFNEQRNDVLNAVADYKECTREFVTLEEPNNDIQSQVEIVFEQICGNIDQLEVCYDPLHEVLLSCMNINTSTDYEAFYKSAATGSIKYICRDGGKTFSDLITDPLQTACLKDIPQMLKHGECPVPNYINLNSSPDCRERIQLVDCFVEALKKKCELQDLVVYMGEAFHAAMDATTCRQYLTTTTTTTTTTDKPSQN